MIVDFVLGLKARQIPFGLIPKGLKDWARGFNSGTDHHHEPALKGAAGNFVPDLVSSLARTDSFYRPWGGLFLRRFPGLKPRAQSFNPFGIGPVPKGH